MRTGLYVIAMLAAFSEARRDKERRPKRPNKNYTCGVDTTQCRTESRGTANIMFGECEFTNGYAFAK